MYKAIVARIKTKEHPNADRLQLGDVLGLQVVVGLETQDNELGIFFNSDGQLSEEFANHNDLVGYTENGERKGGYFGKSRRVRAQNFRNEKSDGFWCPLSYLSGLVSDQTISSLKEGDTFDVLEGIPICNKYYTPKTLKAMGNRNKRARKQFPSFPKHVDTENLYREIDKISDGSLLYFSFKCHGTSQRLGRVWTTHEKPFNLLKPNTWCKSWRTKDRYTYEIGTRNIVLGHQKRENFYGSEQFRYDIVKRLIDENLLHEGEVLYFEVVGYTHNNALIMSSQPIQKSHSQPWKRLRQEYGDSMKYTYGCKPGQCDMFIYRIIRCDSEGNYVEYSWPQLKSRCAELGLKTVPELKLTRYSEDCGRDFLIQFYNSSLKDDLLQAIEQQLEGPDIIDPRHIREGIVIRVEPPTGKPYWLKAKSHTFKLLEGILKDSDSYIDTEEIA